MVVSALENFPSLSYCFLHWNNFVTFLLNADFRSVYFDVLCDQIDSDRASRLFDIALSRVEDANVHMETISKSKATVPT